MRATVLLLMVAVLGIPAVGRAEKVRTNQATSVLSRPGERANVIVKVKEGQVMKVLAKENRWLKVRVSGRTGWVPRSKVDAAEEIVRNTRRRSFVDGRGKDRGFNGEGGPEDRVGADALGATEGREEDEERKPAKPSEDEEEEDEPKVAKKADKKPAKPEKKPAKPEKKPAKPDPAEDEDDISVDEDDAPKTASKKPASKDEDEDTGGDDRPKARVKAKTVAYTDPDPESDESFAATAGMTLYPTGTKKGKYTEVENDQGDIGFVLTSSLAGDDDGGGGGGRTRQIDLRARIGFSFLQQGLRTPGAPVGVPNNYNISTSAATLAIGGALLYPYKARLVIGGEGSYDYAKALPGLKEGDGTTTSIALHKLQLRALIGYDLKKQSGMMIFGRLGLHYHSYQVADAGDLAKNTATLPSEIITAPAIGAALALPRLTPKIGLRFSLDAIVAGASVKQTKNLEDGASPKAKAAFVGAGMVYRLSKFDLQVTYDLNYYSMSYGAMVPTSMRNHMGGNVSRSDFFHSLTIGIAKAL